MGKAFLRAYSLLLIKTCHRAAPSRWAAWRRRSRSRTIRPPTTPPSPRSRADKEREAGDGHDGTWVAHPDLVPVAMEVFDRLMPQPNQLDKLREDVDVGRDRPAARCMRARAPRPASARTSASACSIIEAWLRGRGAVPIYNLMEDAATAEISRAQIWQ